MTDLRIDQYRLPDGTWCCTRDGVTSPCGDCDGCRYVASVNHYQQEEAVTSTDTIIDDRPVLDSIPPPGMFSDLGGRMVKQHEALAANGADFTYDRNGLRLGIAALEDELREVYDKWAAHKRDLNHPDALAGLRHELLDIAAVAMLMYRNVPALCPECDGQGLMSPQAVCRRCDGQGMLNRPA